MELERLVRVSAIIDIFDTEADSGEPKYYKKDRNTDSDIDFGQIFKTACNELKTG